MDDLSIRAEGVRRRLSDLNKELHSREGSTLQLGGSRRSSIDWRVVDESMCDISVLEYERERMSQLEARLQQKDEVIQDMTALQRELTETIDQLNDKVRRLQVDNQRISRNFDSPSPDFEIMKREHERVMKENARLREDLSRHEAQMTLRHRDSQLVRKLQGLISEVCQLDKPPCQRKVWRWVRRLMEDYAKLRRGKPSG
mmetsp:Transcript_32041/g.55247  ORF Transcript_32041/g.55247 Transcript_32041/m.55247 type:complete len:200 (+) Transcript_32041:984-1583(+)